MFHILDCMRTNAYVACKASGYKGSHKEFTMEWCKALSARAKAEEVRETRLRRGSPIDPRDIHGSVMPTSKRRRMSHTKPELPDYRFSDPKEDHHMVMLPLEKKPRTCTYCSYIAALAKGSGAEPEAPRKSKGYCFACGDFLCKDHFEIFHSNEENDMEALETVGI